MNDYERLKVVRKLLWNGKGNCSKNKAKYICHAISLSGKYSNDPQDVKTTQELRLKQLINERLDYVASYENWIIKYHSYLLQRDSTGSYMLDKNLIIQFQLGRIAWVDSMIEEFKDHDCFGNKYR